MPAIFLLGSIALAVAGEVEFLWLAALSATWLAVGFITYSARATRYLTTHKYAGDVRLVSNLRARRVARIYLLGGFLVTLVITALMVALSLGFLLVLALSYFGTLVLGDIDTVELLAGLPPQVFAVFGVVFYFTIFLSYSVLLHVFITLPYWRHVAETLELRGAQSLAEVDQRARDEFEEAEGFAEVLDVGAAL